MSPTLYVVLGIMTKPMAEKCDGGERLPGQLCAVAIMAKQSVPGRVKTRLVPPLTHEEAAEVNTCFLRDVSLNIVAAARHASIQGFAAYHPLGSEDFFRALLPGGFKLLPPKESGIGRSLFHSAQDLLAAGYRSVCLVNSDSPTLPTDFLVETVNRLNQPGDRVVLGPSTDGGYYLIGLKKFHARLFEEIDWSTERVYDQTIAHAREIGLEAVALPEWYDVDDHATLAMLLREIGLSGGVAAPNTAALFRSFGTSLVARLAASSGLTEAAS